ncbi:hypothetical protein GEMRC1_010603 [Eukaryota sp. GEM-RC1]
MDRDVFAELFRFIDDAIRGYYTAENLDQNLRSRQEHFLHFFPAVSFPNHDYTKSDLALDDLHQIFFDRSHLFLSLQLLFVASMDSDLESPTLSSIRSFTETLLSQNLVSAFSSHSASLLNSIQSLGPSNPNATVLAQLLSNECCVVTETLFLATYNRSTPVQSILSVAQHGLKFSQIFDNVVSKGTATLSFSNSVEESLFNCSTFFLFSILNLTSVKSNFISFASPSFLQIKEVENPLIGDHDTQSKMFDLINPSSTNSFHLIVKLSFALLLEFPAASGITLPFEPSEFLSLNPFRPLLALFNWKWISITPQWELLSFKITERPKSFNFGDVHTALVDVLEGVITTSILTFGDCLLEFKHVTAYETEETKPESVLGDVLSLFGGLARESSQFVLDLSDVTDDSEYLISFLSVLAGAPSVLIFERLLQVYSNIAAVIINDDHIGARLITNLLTRGVSSVVSLKYFAEILRTYSSELASANADCAIAAEDLTPLSAILSLFTSIFHHSSGDVDSFVYENSLVSVLVILLLKAPLPLQISSLVVNCLSALVRHGSFRKIVLTELTLSKLMTFWQSVIVDESKDDEFYVSLSILHFVKTVLESSTVNQLEELKIDDLIVFTRDQFIPKLEFRAKNNQPHRWALITASFSLISTIANSAVSDLNQYLSIKSSRQHLNPIKPLSQSFETLVGFISDSLLLRTVVSCLNGGLSLLLDSSVGEKSEVYSGVLIGLQLIGIGLSASNHLMAVSDLIKSYTPSYLTDLPNLLFRNDRGRMFIFLMFKILNNSILAGISADLLTAIVLLIPKFKQLFDIIPPEEFHSLSESVCYSLINDTSSMSSSITIAEPLIPYHDALLAKELNESRYNCAYFLRTVLQHNPHHSGILQLLKSSKIFEISPDSVDFSDSPIFNVIFDILNDSFIVAKNSALVFELFGIISETCNALKHPFSVVFPTRFQFITRFVDKSIHFPEFTAIMATSSLWSVIALEIHSVYLMIDQNVSDDGRLTNVQALIELITNQRLFDWIDVAKNLLSSENPQISNIWKYLEPLLKLIQVLVLDMPLIKKPFAPEFTPEYADFIFKILYELLNMLNLNLGSDTDISTLCDCFVTVTCHCSNCPPFLVSPESFISVITELFKIMSKKLFAPLFSCRLIVAATSILNYLNILPPSDSDVCYFQQTELSLLRAIKEDGRQSNLIRSLIEVFKSKSIIAQLECLSFLSLITDSTSRFPSLSSLFATELVHGPTLSIVFGQGDSFSLVPSVSFSTKSSSKLANQLSVYESKCHLLISLSRHPNAKTILDFGILSSLCRAVTRLYAGFSFLQTQTHSNLIDDQLSRVDYHLRIFSAFFKVFSAFSMKLKSSRLFELASYFLSNIHALPPTNSLLTSEDNEVSMCFVSDFFTFLNSCIFCLKSPEIFKKCA